MAAGNQRELAAHRALHQHLDDQHAIDFVGAFKDTVNTRVANTRGTLDNPHEIRSREDLHGFVTTKSSISLP